MPITLEEVAALVAIPSRVGFVFLIESLATVFGNSHSG
jgi:hypothetical protein